MTIRDLDQAELKYADRDVLAERLAILQQERADHTPDVDYTHGVREALQRVLAAVQIRHEFTAADVRQIAQEMGVELKGPRA